MVDDTGVSIGVTLLVAGFGALAYAPKGGPEDSDLQSAIDRFLVSALYHEAKRRGLPMTKLVNGILEEKLQDSHGWRVAEESASYDVRARKTTSAE